MLPVRAASMIVDQGSPVNI